MITSYVPRPARWIPAVVLAPVAVLWGGFAIIGYVNEPKWTSPGGTAAEHVRRGDEIMGDAVGADWNDYYGPDERGVSVAALEYESALLLDPTDESAALGKALCLQALADAWERQPASVYRRQALGLAEGVLSRTKNRELRVKALKRVAGLHDALGEVRPAIAAYRRLLPMLSENGERESAEEALAGVFERGGNLQASLELFRKLERQSNYNGWHMEDVKRLQRRLASRPR